LVNFDNSGYSALIPICLKKRKVIDFQPYETDKLIILTKDNLLQIFKFQTFGHYEKIAQYNSFPKELKLTNLSMCPNQKYLIVVNFKEKSQLKKYEKVITLKIEKNKKLITGQKGYKIEMKKLFEAQFNFKASDKIWVDIPFYWQEKPILAVYEREMKEPWEGVKMGSAAKKKKTRGRFYFYSFSDKKCEVVKDLVFPGMTDIAGFGVGQGSVFQIGIDGDLLKVCVEK